MNSTARSASRNILTAVIAVVGMITALYVGMWIRTEIDPYFSAPDNQDYVTVTHTDGTQTWEKIGTLCPAGKTEVGAITGETYNFHCE